MIQRKQTLYLLAAFLLQAICLCLPVGTISPVGMGVGQQVYNLCIIQPEGTSDFSVWPLFVLLLVACPVALCCIFLYKNRKLQASLCLLNMALLVGWLAVYAILFFQLPEEGKSFFHISYSASLPFVSLVLHWLARKGILADEALVRSMDRIR